MNEIRRVILAATRELARSRAMWINHLGYPAQNVKKKKEKKK